MKIVIDIKEAPRGVELLLILLESTLDFECVKRNICISVREREKEEWMKPYLKEE